MSDNVIFSYTRQEALSDGVLVDLSDLAREAGFRWPLAATSRLYHEYLVPMITLVYEGQSTIGRVWDLLNVLKYDTNQAKPNSSIRFTVLFVMSPGTRPVPIDIVATVGPGDSGEPVITCLLPDED